MTETAPKVIVIPAKKETPQEQARKRNLRVAAYCRVSTNSKEQLTSYENQLAYYTEKIMKNPSGHWRWCSHFQTGRRRRVWR